MQFELARSSDEPALRRLLRAAPFAGDIRVTLEREPCIDLANAIEGERTQILVARRAEGVVAMGARTLRTSFVNGTPTRVGYLGQLRVLPQYQGRAALLRRGYTALRALHGDGAAALYVTTIVADNRRARRVLEAGLPGLPTYRHVGDLWTLLLTPRRRRQRHAGGVTVAAATPSDVEEIARCLARYGARFQFAPCWTAADLCSAVRSRGLAPGDFLVARRGPRIVGCAACWDQRGFKQVVVRAYCTRLRLARPLWNLLAPLRGSPRLPPVGTALAFGYLSHLAVDDDDPRVFQALVDAGLRAAAGRGLEHLTLGLAERNPLAATALTRFRSRPYRSRAYLVYWSDGETAAGAVDARPMHLEAAIL
jgi:predicted N-acetyltransferase YhbS